jgi:hypothetical protein
LLHQIQESINQLQESLMHSCSLTVLPTCGMAMHCRTLCCMSQMVCFCLRGIVTAGGLTCCIRHTGAINLLQDTLLQLCVLTWQAKEMVECEC